MSKKQIVGDDGRTYIMKEKKPFYKRLWFIILAVIVGLSVLGNALGEDEEKPQKISPSGEETVITSNEPQEDTTEESSAPEKEEEKEVVFTVGDTVQNDKMEFTLTNVETNSEITDDSGFLSFRPDSENNRYLTFDVIIKNISNEAISLDSSGFRLFKGETRYIPTTILNNRGLNIETINPGTEIERQVYFDVPADVAESDELRVEIESGIFSRTGQTIIIHLD